jgi:quercetin dioxygenase-like cupin family protein
VVHWRLQKERNVKRLLLVVGVIASFAGSVVGGQEKAGHADDAKHVAVRPDVIKWGQAPPGLPPGAQMAVLVGDPTKSGAPYVVRAKLPDGYKIPPHWHPSDENITVLKGTLLIGNGEKLDPSKAEELPAGSFMRMPKQSRHFALAKGETIIQLHGTEPFEITYVNPADDPRKKEDAK